MKISSVVRKLLMSNIEIIEGIENDKNVKIHVGKEAINITGAKDRVDAAKNLLIGKIKKL